MTNEDLIKVLMASIPGIIIGLAGVLAGWRKDRNRPMVDSSEADKNVAAAVASLVDSLAKQGKSFTDLVDDLSEIPQLKTDLKITQADLKIAQGRISDVSKELDWQNRRATFFINFAKENWTGAQHLYGVIKMNGLDDQTQWKPSEKFPTGPLVGATS